MSKLAIWNLLCFIGCGLTSAALGSLSFWGSLDLKLYVAGAAGVMLGNLHERVFTVLSSLEKKD